MSSQTRALLSYVQSQAQRLRVPLSTDTDKLRFLNRIINTTEQDWQKFKSGVNFRYFMCGLIGVSFGVVCYILFRRVIRNQDEEMDEGNDTECVVCSGHVRRVVFTPCLHIICCYQCADRVRVCPMCRVPIESKYSIARFLNALEI